MYAHVARFPETRTEAERIQQTPVQAASPTYANLDGDARALTDQITLISHLSRSSIDMPQVPSPRRAYTWPIVKNRELLLPSLQR